MIEIQLAISHPEDRHILVAPVDPRMIVVLEDGWPGDGPDDAHGQEGGPEGSVQGVHLSRFLSLSNSELPTSRLPSAPWT